MNKIIKVVGNESSVLDFYMNKQFSSYDKLIITKEILFSSFNEDIYALMDQKPNEKSVITPFINETVKPFFEEVSFTEDFYKYLQEQLVALSPEYDINLKDYNFMSSISNTKYTLTLRCPEFSISEFYVEKGAMLSAIKTLCNKYLSTSLTYLKSSSIDNIQIEIFQSEEIAKTLFLKKEHDILLLYSNVGIYPREGVNMLEGGEMYFSKGEDFQFFENDQTTATVREYNNFELKHIQHIPKILSSQELKLINEKTKSIESALIEIGITNKGGIKILHVSTIEQPLEKANERGVILYSSSKLYDKISLITKRSGYDENAVNPQYLLIKNAADFKEVVEHLHILQFDGLVFNYPVFHPFFDSLGESLDIDVFYYKDLLCNELEISFNKDDILLEGRREVSSQDPFSSILTEENKEKDQFVSQLSSVDLSTPKAQVEQNRREFESIEKVAESLVSSEDSSTAKPAPSSDLMGFSSGTSPTGKKLSAIEMMTQSVMNNDLKPKREETKYQQPTPEPVYEQPTPTPEPTYQQTEAVYETPKASPLDFAEPTPAAIGDVVSASLKVEETITATASLSESEIMQYDTVLGTKLSTPVTVASSQHLITPAEFSQISDEAELFVLVSSLQEMNNKSLQYVLPLSCGLSNEAHPFLQSAEDYFKLLKEDVSSLNKEIFVNLSSISKDVRNAFLTELSSVVSSYAIIINKEDLEDITDFIGHISLVHVRNLLEVSEVNLVKEKLLSFEKKELMKLVK